MKYQFYTCDVFANQRFGGNQLAVIPNAEGLSTEQMQLIAREFNFSETTFVLPAKQGNACNLRIFTRQEELPFAGHPNIGTAFVLARNGVFGNLEQTTQIIFEEKAGLVPIIIHKRENDELWCELKAPEALSLGDIFSKERIAEILCISSEDISAETHLPQQASVGLPFVIAELRSSEILKNVTVNIDALRKLEADGIFPAIYVYIRSNDEFDIRGRMFAPLGGTYEDPATGSVNCALAGLLTHYYKQKEGKFSWHIAQGVEMNRPSVLHARSEKRDGEVSGVWIGGNCVMISEGQIEV